jgi:molybdenum cofactor cytidylyltransferase
MIGIIILAAGASTRMGHPKQLLPYQEENLLQHAIDTALGTGCYPVIVVLGATANEIEPAIKNNNITIAENKQWQEGLGSSVRAGISALIQHTPRADSAILMLCDQPFVTAALLKHLVETKAATNKNIVASIYGDTVGVPVLFDQSFFPELLQLQGQDGAKKLLSIYAQDVATVSFPEAAVDIDTPEDYHTLVLNAGSI